MQVGARVAMVLTEGDAMATERQLDWPTARALAVRANVDPRSILAVARGEQVRGAAGHRARAVLVEAGYLTPSTPATAIEPRQ